MFAEGKPPPEMKKGIERIMANPQLQEAMGQGMGIGGLLPSASFKPMCAYGAKC